jgi:hypothetical protein
MSGTTSWSPSTDPGGASGMRGRYAVSDPLFRRYLERQTCAP